jgi:hypothetical protein
MAGGYCISNRTLFALRVCLPALIVLFLFSESLLGQPTPALDAASDFETIEQMIPMRDGVKLRTLIYTPRSHHDRLPILFKRTPYGIDNASTDFTSSLKPGPVLAISTNLMPFSGPKKLHLRPAPLTSESGVRWNYSFVLEAPQFPILLDLSEFRLCQNCR